MKKRALHFSLAMLVTCSAMFIKTQSASAQVDMNLLTEIAKSCQKDTTSSEYYKQMSLDDNIIQSAIGSVDSLENCIRARYRYSLVQSKFPWLASTGEMIPGYPGSVAVSLMAYSPKISSYYLNSWLESSSLLDCLISQDPSTHLCVSSLGIFYDNKIQNQNVENEYIYVCPSCVVARDNISSAERMRGSFIQWFLNLDKLTRRQSMSILGNNKEAQNSRTDMMIETVEAVDKYNAIREKVAREKKDRLRREVIGD